MDVYGFSNPYQQSDELAKQMYAQQALANNMPYDRQVAIPMGTQMPAPSGAPWNMQQMPWGMMTPPQLVQFTAQTPQPTVSPVVHCKRKSLDVVPAIPAKQLITEEKMAAHLNGLHISSNYTNYSLSPEEVMEVAQEPIAKSKAPKIVLSEELKKLQSEPLLPPALLQRLEKPCMSIVLWKPKDEILKQKTDEKDAEESSKRKGVLVADDTVSLGVASVSNNNVMDIEIDS